jgi:hypothetical protein
MVRRAAGLILALAIAGCGGDAPTDPDGPDAGLLAAIADLPGVVAVEEVTTRYQGYRRFEIGIAQPVEHDVPGGATFTQRLTLFHRDPAAPVVLLSTGYWNYVGDRLAELTGLVDANQLVVEHRYFGGSRPADPDWGALTIENAAGDHHRVTQAFRRLYGGAWLASGASKGGMTSIYHRRFWPDDVDATVAYVAPISFGAPDYRYDAFVDGIGPPACRQALQELQVELLTNRRATLEARAAAQAAEVGVVYTRLELGAAVESAVAGLVWSFWQYVGASWCDDVPPLDASDDRLWEFLEVVAPVASSADARLAAFEAYYFQAEYELGYPGTVDEWLDGLLQYGEEAYAGIYPAGAPIPPFRAAAMEDVDAWVQTGGERLLFLYGEWDPWTGGQFALGGAADSLVVTVPRAPHGARLLELPPDQQDQALARLAAWTGVTPSPRAAAAWRGEVGAEPPPPRLPPAILQAMRLR